MKIVIASDHAGLQLRAELVEYIKTNGHEITDLGPLSPESVDYPNYAAKVAGAIGRGEYDLGVLVCGTGIGMSITANKVKGVRAALCTSEFEAKMARAHNDANVLCLGQRVIGAGVARGVMDAFIGTPFEGGRHQKRVDLIARVEREGC